MGTLLITPLILVKSLVRSGERMLYSSLLKPVSGAAAAAPFCMSLGLLLVPSDSVSGAAAALPFRVLLGLSSMFKSTGPVLGVEKAPSLGHVTAPRT